MKRTIKEADIISIKDWKTKDNYKKNQKYLIAIIDEQDFMLIEEKDIKEIETTYKRTEFLDVELKEIVGFLLGLTYTGTTIYDINYNPLPLDTALAVRKYVISLL